MDYFSLFDLPHCYEIDQATLATRYQDLQRLHHPDRAAHLADNERLAAMQKASMINDAYQSLKHPLRRAEYMLTLHDIDVNSETYRMNDTAFLMQQLELRETLDEIAQQQDEDKLAHFATSLKTTFRTLKETMQQQLSRCEWQEAAESVSKLRFLDKVQQQVDLFEDKFADF